MSVEYSNNIAVGFKVEIKSLEKAMGKVMGVDEFEFDECIYDFGKNQLKCDAVWFGDMIGGMNQVAFCVKIKEDKDTEGDCGIVCFGPDLFLDDVFKKAQEIKDLEKRLDEKRIKHGKAMIINAWTIT